MDMMTHAKENKVFVTIVCALLLLAVYKYCSCNNNPFLQAKDLLCGKDE